MSSPSKKKKIVVTTSNTAKAPVRARRSSASAPKTQAKPTDLVFGKVNFLWMIGGVLLIALGLVLMSGGKMPSPDVWDESLIYSPRRIILAPAIILLGLIVEIIAIFKKAPPEAEEA